MGSLEIQVVLPETLAREAEDNGLRIKPHSSISTLVWLLMTMKMIRDGQPLHTLSTVIAFPIVRSTRTRHRGRYDPTNHP